MKIGIITFHCSYNYGSALQAYALLTYFKKNRLYSENINIEQEIDFSNSEEKLNELSRSSKEF